MIRVVFKGILVAAIVPTGIIDGVQPMGAAGGGRKASGFVAGSAFDQGAGEPLKQFGRIVVIGAVRSIGPYGVGAAVAGLAGKTAMPLAEAKKGIRIFGKNAC
jgi:hypothetical protein